MDRVETLEHQAADSKQQLSVLELITGMSEQMAHLTNQLAIVISAVSSAPGIQLSPHSPIVLESEIIRPSNLCSTFQAASCRRGLFCSHAYAWDIQTPYACAQRIERDRFSDQGCSDQDTLDQEFALSARARFAGDTAHSREVSSHDNDKCRETARVLRPTHRRRGLLTLSRVHGGSNVKIQDPSSVSQGVIGRTGFDPEAVLKSRHFSDIGPAPPTRIRRDA